MDFLERTGEKRSFLRDGTTSRTITTLLRRGVGWDCRLERLEREWRGSEFYDGKRVAIEIR